MYILTYLNHLEDKDYLDSITVKRLCEHLRAIHKMAADYYFYPRSQHAENIIREISDWDIEEVK